MIARWLAETHDALIVVSSRRTPARALSAICTHTWGHASTGGVALPPSAVAPSVDVVTGDVADADKCLPRPRSIRTAQIASIMRSTPRVGARSSHRIAGRSLGHRDSDRRTAGASSRGAGGYHALVPISSTSATLAPPDKPPMQPTRWSARRAGKRRSKRRDDRLRRVGRDRHGLTRYAVSTSARATFNRHPSCIRTSARDSSTRCFGELTADGGWSTASTADGAPVCRAAHVN